MVQKHAKKNLKFFLSKPNKKKKNPKKIVGIALEPCEEFEKK
jgi:hypothetical protein